LDNLYRCPCRTRAHVAPPKPRVQKQNKRKKQKISLGGMGCANGVVGLSLLRSMLQAHPGAKAVFVTSEICSSAFYQG